ncbi:MAG: pirin family protein [Halobellus sp.]|uniref:pirin family protein n=1 Tax=Halobellus sp. TaxID=1979212 RepID=UPI0035D4C9CC
MTTSEDAANGSHPVAGEQVQHDTGVNSNRAFPTSNYADHLDPFVLFERFCIDPDVGFPMHPHKGFEIVSYLLDGGMAHEDSLGVANTAYAGEVMRITTGSGIRHSEFPAASAACNGLQLWVNLPRERKSVDADYEDASAEELPTRTVNGGTVTTVVGEGSPITLHTDVEYLDATVDSSWTWTVPEGWSGFCYGVDGSGTVADDTFSEGDVYPVTDATAEGDDESDREIKVTSDSGLRVVAVVGRPHGEAIRQRGPFVF